MTTQKAPQREAAALQRAQLLPQQLVQVRAHIAPRDAL